MCFVYPTFLACYNVAMTFIILLLCARTKVFFWFLKYYCYEYCFSPFEMGNDIKFSYLKFVLYLRLKIEMQD